MTGPQPPLLPRYHSIIDDPEEFEASLRRPLDGFIWVNTLRISPDRLCGHLREDGFSPKPLPWHPAGFRIRNGTEPLGKHWAYFAGCFHIQEAASMLPVLVLDPKPGDRILDLCAAPGNKTAQAALALNNRGTVAANDAIRERLGPLRANIHRLGLANVCITQYDGNNYPKAAGRFDGILVDVPCSCEGTCRKYPAILHRPDRFNFRKLRRQRLLLEQAVFRCRAGGRILYSTCTFAPEENEAVIDGVLRKWPERVRVLPASLPGLKSAPGIVEWEGKRFHPDLEKTLRIWPHLNDTAGFYLALLEKIGPESKPPGALPALGDPDFGFEAGERMAPLGDPGTLLQEIEDRYGIDGEIFLEIRFFVRKNRIIHAAAQDHRPPGIPDRVFGLPFMHTGKHLFKLTTHAASAFGHLATRNTIDADPDQIRRYLARETFLIRTDQADCCDRDGYVLVRHAGIGVGVGFYKRSESAVASLFPKHRADG